MDQQFLLDIVLNSEPWEIIDIPAMKAKVKDYSKQVKDTKESSNFDELRKKLHDEVVTIDEAKKQRADAAVAKVEQAKQQAAAEAAVQGAAATPDDKAKEAKK